METVIVRQTAANAGNSLFLDILGVLSLCELKSTLPPLFFFFLCRLKYRIVDLDTLLSLYQFLWRLTPSLFPALYTYLGTRALFVPFL